MGPPDWLRDAADPATAIPGIVVTDRAALRAWLDSTVHRHECAARDEGLSCCLDWLGDDPADLNT